MTRKPGLMLQGYRIPATFITYTTEQEISWMGGCVCSAMSAGPRTPIPTSSARTAGNPFPSDNLQHSRQSASPGPCGTCPAARYVYSCPGAAGAAPKRKRNWLGMVSLIRVSSHGAS